jgi:hypothetical protein
MTKLTWPQAISWHMRRQHLDARLPRAKLLSLVSELCGLHAQVMSSAELTALSRIEGLRPGDISKALWQERKLVKTWAMRRTLHLLPASEYAMWIRACGLYDGPKSPAWLDYFGISQNELEAITEAVPTALGDHLLTREALADEIVRLTGIAHVHDKLRLGWGSLLKPACYKGYLCFGPNKGQHTQFAYPGGLGESEDNSGAAVARKYLAAYGPATIRDFSRWLYGGTASRATRAMLAALGEEAVEVDVEGIPAWMLRKHLRPASQNEPVRGVRLLPAFDQYVFAAGLRSARVLPGDFHARVYRSQGWFSPVLVVDGRMDGVWPFERKGKRLVVTIEPFVGLKANVRRVAGEEAERIARFMERELELKWV